MSKQTKPKRKTLPRYVLSNEWGLGYDSLNWILYKRVYDKETGVPSGWKRYKFFGKLSHLAKEMAELTLCLKSNTPSLVQHFSNQLQAVEDAVMVLESLLPSLRADMFDEIKLKGQDDGNQ